VPDAYYRIGESFIREGNEKGALEPYINAFNNYPEHPEGEKTLFWIANYCFKIKDYQEALYYYHKLKDWFGDAEFADQAYYQIALIHYYRQEYGQTRKYLAGLFRRFPVSPMVPKAYLLLGDSYTEYPDFPLKEKAYNDVLKRDPLSRDAFFRLGEMYRNLRLMDKAVGQYRQVIKPVFDDPYKKYHISHDPLVDSARYEVSQPDSLIRLDSLWQKSQLRIAECLLEKGDKTMALQGLEVFIQLDISDENRWEAYRLYADYYYNKGDYKQALRFFQQLPDGYSMPFRSLYFKGMAYIKAEQYHKAVEVLKNLLSQWEKVPDPKQATFNHDLATFALADALFKEKRYLEAVNHYRQLVAGDDDYVLYRISECYRYLNLRKEAGEVLKKLLAKYPNKYYDIQQERAQVDTTWQDSYMSYLAKIVGHSPF
jgi:tetratricopeptide (TPR) repeat protein